MSNEPTTLSTATSTSLLEGLKDPANRAAWVEFDDRYRPRIFGYARSAFDLSRADAEDAAQEVLKEFFRCYVGGDYDREKGRLRKWLFGIATRQIKNFIRRKGRDRLLSPAAEASGTGFPESIPDDDRLEKQWEQEWMRALYQLARVRAKPHFDPKTFEAYVRYWENREPVKDVANALGMTVDSVYLAKCRVSCKIAEILRPLLESES